MPMCRPASAMTRRELASPASARSRRSRMRWTLGSSRNSSSRAGPPASVSRQPRLPHLQIGPFSSIVTCPIWARLAGDAAEHGSVDQEAGADGVSDADVGRAPGSARGAGARPRRGRRGWPRCRRTPDARGGSRGPRRSGPPPSRAGGRGVEDHAGGRIHGGRERDPDGQHVREACVQRLKHVAEQQGGAIELAVVPVVEGERDVVLGDDGAPDVGDGHPQVPAREVEPGDQADLAPRG